MSRLYKIWTHAFKVNFLFIIAYASLFSSVRAQQVIEKQDIYTFEKSQYEKVDFFADASPMTKEKCDGVIYISEGENFYKRILPIQGMVNVKWFGAKGNGDKNDKGTDDTEAVKKAIEVLSRIYKGYPLSGGNVYAGFTLYFPAGKYIVSETIKLPNGITLRGESVVSTIIHAKTPKILFTNIQGFGKNGIEQIASENVTVEHITLTQGGIELQQATGSLIKDVRIMNLSGKGTDTGIIIRLSVNLKIENVKIFGSSGVGIHYEDAAGTGPSTTTTLDRIWVAHCKTGMLVDGKTGGSHGIFSSKIYNSIFEYNDIGLEFKGNVENFSVRDSHFEQNRKNTILISGRAKIFFENNWTDKGGITIQSNTDKNSKIFLKEDGMPVDNLSSINNIFYQQK